MERTAASSSSRIHPGAISTRKSSLVWRWFESAIEFGWVVGLVCIVLIPLVTLAIPLCLFELGLVGKNFWNPDWLVAPIGPILSLKDWAWSSIPPGESTVFRFDLGLKVFAIAYAINGLCWSVIVYTTWKIWGRIRRDRAHKAGHLSEHSIPNPS